MGYRIIINISSSSICYLFFIISITRRKITFSKHEKGWLFNICFLIVGGSIQTKEGSSNMNYMRKLFIMINFIRECRGQEILRERQEEMLGLLHASSFISYKPSFPPSINYFLNAIVPAELVMNINS